MIRKLVDKFARMVLRPISKGVTIFVAVYTIIWGLWLINPFWQVFTTADLYSGLNSFAPEWFWGLFAIAAGGMALVSTIDHRYPATAFTSAAIAGWHWLIVGILYMYGDWHNTGGITALFLAVLCAYIFLNVHANDGYK